MSESESKKENRNGQEHRFDPELLKEGLRCDLDQYEMLKRCSDKKDMTEWNEWRGKKPEMDILLQEADLSEKYLAGVLLNTGVISEFQGNVNLAGAKFQKSILTNASFTTAYLKNAKFNEADLRKAKLQNARLEGAIFYHARLEGANLRTTIVDGYTSFWAIKINNQTNFRGVGLNNCRIDSATKQLLEYNIRRINWEDWYKEHPKLKWLVKPFWWMSDYGLSTGRIIAIFFGLAVVFAVVYRLWPNSVMVNQVVGDIRGFWHALYFSVVTMTTLGFGDIAANPDSSWGQTLLMAQVILGYVLLGALVTRFAVLFTAGGPAGRFAKEN
jgi:hypothetical protein